MMPHQALQSVRDREAELRRRAEAERRRRAERVRDDPFGMDAEIHALIEADRRQERCLECDEELAREAG